jgi:hypothetical protein
MQSRLSSSAARNNIVSVEYSPDKLDAKFIEKNKSVLSNQRGAGYWLWKPYIILNALSKLDNDGCLIYCDADVVILENPEPLFNSDGYFLCRNYNGILNKYWVKKECYEIVDNKNLGDDRHIEACVMGFRKNEKNIKLINEWLTHCENERYVSDTRYIEQAPEFRDHRHDQAIMSVLVHKHNLNITPIEIIGQYFNIGK